MGNKSILQCNKQTRERFNKLRLEYADIPDCNDNVFLNEMMDYVEEELSKE